MFVYALIAAELVMLYVVFWYLFLRDPDAARKIAGGTWGGYEKKKDSTRYEAAAVQTEEDHCDCQYCGCSDAEHAVKAFMVPVPGELVFDRRKNRYISKRKYYRGRSRIANLLQRIDEELSRFNVRP